MGEKSEKNLAAHLFSQREENFEHASLDREIAVYESICSGDIELVKLLATPLCSEGYGILSKNSLQNLKYHFVVSAAIIARFCINNGMTVETAYNLSDLFILKADECTSEDEVHAIHSEMLESYTNNMKKVKKSRIYSKQIINAIDYISDHLHDKITISETAEHLKISTSYLSRLFKAETGVAFSEYVNRRKIETAVNLLRFSEYSDSEISNILSFSSQSYFIKVFKKNMGLTPREYRTKYIMSAF